jgi:glycosyltransferase involved in cell wall biosynthesis
MEERKKILVIGPLPPPFAGPEMVTRAIVESDSLRQRFEIAHLNTTVRASNRDKGHLDGRMVFAYASYLVRLGRHLTLQKPDCVLYLPTSATLKGWVRDGSTLPLASLRGCKTVILFQGGHFRFFYERLSKPVRTVIRRLLASCDRVLVQGTGLQKQFDGIVSAERIGVQHNLVPWAFYRHFENRRFNKGTGPLNVLFVGHLSAAKGYCDLIRVIPNIARETNVRFRFMGTRKTTERNVFFDQVTGRRIEHLDPDALYRTYIVERGLDTVVEYLGDRVFGTRKLEIFAEADVFVLPSYSEGFSTAILEAMAAGLPMVVTRVGVVPEILRDGEHAFLIDPGDLDGLRDRLLRLLRDADLRRRMGERNRSLCGKEFVEGIVIDRLGSHLSKVLSE